MAPQLNKQSLSKGSNALGSSTLDSSLLGSNLSSPNIVALSGGVGGAKLALGLSHILPPKQLTVVANTADDFEHLGLAISPDLDTVMYTLADLNNKQQGWGIADESWACMQAVEKLGGETWFRLGDKDIATHLHRSLWLNQGKTLTEVTQELCFRLGIKTQLLPMCDETVHTFVQTGEGKLPFQEYFVKRQCRPEVTGFEFQGIELTQLTPQLQSAIAVAEALIICPSNPFVSIAPILAVNDMRKAFITRNMPRIVVSPIVGGIAIKGPAAKMMQELNMPSTALAVAEYYKDFATHFVLDSSDQKFRQAISDLGLIVIVTNTVMNTLDDRKQLASDILSQI